MKKALQLVLLFILALTMLPAGVQSQQQQEESEGIIVSPPTLSQNAEAGVNISETFLVINQRGRTEDFTVYSKEVEVAPDGSFFVPEGLAEGTSRFELEGWLDFSPRQFTLEDGGTQEVVVTMNLPEQLPTNGYYLELAFAVGVPNGASTVGTVPEVAIPLLVNHISAEDPIRQLNVFGFVHENIYPHIIYEYLPVNFFTTLENTGNMHIAPVGSIFIDRDPGFFDPVGTIEFNTARQTVFAGATRNFQNVWNNSLLVYQNNQLEVNFGEPLQIGRYFAQLNIAWDAERGKDIATAVVEFWVIPWKLILGIILVLIIQLVLIRSYFSRRGKSSSGEVKKPIYQR